MPRTKKIRLGILLELFFDASMLLIFMVQTFIAGCLLIYGYLPIPSEWGNQLIAKKLPPGIILRVDEIRLRSDVSIEFVGIELRSANIEQVLFRADAAELKLRWRGLTQAPSAESLLLSGGTLYSPSVYSPNGYHSPILERVAFRMVPGEVNWNIDRFAALHATIRLRGSIELPSSIEAAGDSLDYEALIKTFYKQAAALAQQKERISYFLTPTIAFQSSILNADTQEIELRVTSRQMQHPEAKAERIQLRGAIQLKNGEITPTSSPRLTAQYLEIPRFDLVADSLSAEFPSQEFDGFLAEKWPRLKLAAQKLKLQDFELDVPTLQIDPLAYPQLSFHGATHSLNGAIDLSGQLDAQQWNGQVRARGSVDLVTLAPKKVSEKLPEIVFEKPPYYNLSLDFDEGFALKRADLRAQVESLRVDELSFDHINAQASYADGLFTIENLYLRRQKQWIDLQFSLDTASSDYRVALIGTAVPYEYNALLPSWWASIFKDFDFSQTTYSLGDFIIYGNTQRKTSDLYYGHAEARKVSYSGVALDEAELIVRGRGAYCELHDLNARSGSGWARGDIAFASKQDDVNGPASIRLEMEAKLTLEDAAKLFSGNIATIINDFKTEGLPTTKLQGVIFNKAYPEYVEKSHFDLSAELDQPLSFKEVPLDRLRFDLFGRTGVTHLRNVELGYADGQATSMIDIFTPKGSINSLRYQLTLKDADQNQALRDLPQLDEVEGSLESANTPTTPRASRENARIDLQIRGQGPIEDPLKHIGFGRFEIRNDKLGTIQLLGPLSKILQNTQLSFTSFNLNTMRGDFRYENDLVTFDPLRIDGPRTQINTPGTLRLSDQSLYMNVKVNLFGNAGNPDSNLRKIGDLITKPLPNLLQFELTGTLKDQKLRSLYDPRNLIPRF